MANRSGQQSSYYSLRRGPTIDNRMNRTADRHVNGKAVSQRHGSFG